MRKANVPTSLGVGVLDGFGGVGGSDDLFSVATAGMSDEKPLWPTIMAGGGGNTEISSTSPPEILFKGGGGGGSFLSVDETERIDDDGLLESTAAVIDWGGGGRNSGNSSHSEPVDARVDVNFISSGSGGSLFVAASDGLMEARAGIVSGGGGGNSERSSSSKQDERVDERVEVDVGRGGGGGIERGRVELVARCSSCR